MTIPRHQDDSAVEVRWYPVHRFWVAFDPGKRILFGLKDVVPQRGERVEVTLDLVIPRDGMMLKDYYTRLNGFHRDNVSLQLASSDFRYVQKVIEKFQHSLVYTRPVNRSFIAFTSFSESTYFWESA